MVSGVPRRDILSIALALSMAGVGVLGLLGYSAARIILLPVLVALMVVSAYSAGERVVSLSEDSFAWVPLEPTLFVPVGTALLFGVFWILTYTNHFPINVVELIGILLIPNVAYAIGLHRTRTRHNHDNGAV